MEREITRLLDGMMAYDAGDPMRIQHFIKVYLLAKRIGEGERLDPLTQFTLESAALVHDIGIHVCEKKYDGACHGALQEREGPAEAEKLLNGLGWPEEVTRRVCYLVGHHHTYTNIEGMDYQILVEADFLVNFYEDAVPEANRRAALERIFKTETGKRLCRLMYGE